jgi:hypothetical protein
MIVVQHRTADDTKVVRIEWEEGDMEVDTDEDDVAEDEDNTGDADVHGTAAADADEHIVYEASWQDCCRYYALLPHFQLVFSYPFRAFASCVA